MIDGIQLPNVIDEPETSSPAPVSVGAILGGRYRIEKQIAEGGMATVFLAVDLRHDREVAVKVLHESLTHTIGIQRFLREIEVIARLQHPHLLTLIDSGVAGGYPYYVMPYVEAQSLRETITERGQLPLEDAITIAREVADALAYAHERGVVHRDIKPSNILMSAGHAVVADFGIATAIHKSTVGRITVNGTSLGSPTYMSPEQAAGETDVDPRSDVYSLACVVFEMLTGRPPIDHLSLQQMVTSKLTGAATRLRELRPDLPVVLETALHTALAPDRAARFATMEEFSRALAASLPTKPRFSPRVKWTVGVIALAVLGAAGAYVQKQRRIVWATQQVTEISRLLHETKLHAAFTLAQQVQPILPNDTTLRALRLLLTDYLKVVTVPAGARVSIQRIDATDTTWTAVGVTPIDSLAMPKLLHEKGYRMRIERTGYESVDLFASVFTKLNLLGGEGPIDTLHLDPVGSPTAGMARIRGFTVQGPNGDLRVYKDYHIGKREVTNREYKRFVDAGGYRDRQYWTEPMERDGKAVHWEDGVARLLDRTGQPGPSTWSRGTFPSGEDEFPVGGLSWYEASAYARFAKMQLPTVPHWRRAASRNSREVLWMYIQSANMNSARVRPAGQGMINAWGLYDVAGNVREWCVNRMGSGRLTQGGAWEDSPFHITHLIALDPFDRSPGNGVRLAHITDSDSLVARLASPVETQTLFDFNTVRPVSDATFAAFRRMYDYDAKPLETKLEAEGETQELRWQKVSFTAAYDGPRMAAYLFFPKNVSAPFEPVIIWGAANALTARRLDPTDRIFDIAEGFLARSGRVLVLPLYMGTYERDDSAFSISSWRPDTTTRYRDQVVDQVKDLRRTIDFLETRKDVRADRIGFHGGSWGGMMAPYALSMEPRIKAAVLYSAGYPGYKARAEVEPYNYSPRVRTPTLMENGQFDTVFPYETSQLPFFRLLGTPARNKDIIMGTGGHMLPLEQVIPATLAWFDKYLSGKADAAGSR